MLLILFWACLIRCTTKTLLLYDTCRVIKRSSCDKALLSSRSLNIENEAICREFLAALDPEDVSRFRICPGNGQESLHLPGDHKILNGLCVDLVSHFPLSQFQGEISHAHERDVNRQSHDRKWDLYLVVLLRVQDQQEEDYCKDVLEMEGCVKYEVPYAVSTLIPICIYLIGVFDLVRYNLM